MKRFVWCAAALGLLLGAAGQAQADLYHGGNYGGGGKGGQGGGNDPPFFYSFEGPGVDVSGVLNATPNGDGTYTAVSGSGSGTANGSPVSMALYPNPAGTSETLSPSGFFIYDDQLLPGQNPLVTNGGLLFMTSGGLEVNIFSNGPGQYVYYDNSGFNVNGQFSLTAATPEPASLTMLGLGVLGLGGYAWRRRKAAPR